MQPTTFLTSKIDFFLYFEDGISHGKQFEVGINQKIEVKIHARKLDELDKRIFTYILEKSNKQMKFDEITCLINVSILMIKFGITEADIYSRIRKYVSIGLDETTETTHSEYNFCTLVKYTRDSKPSLIEITFCHLEALKKHFSSDFIHFLTKDASRNINFIEGA